MSEENAGLGTYSLPNQNLSVVSNNAVPIDRSSLSRKVVRCTTCSQVFEYTEGHEYCGICGAPLGLLISESHIADREPNLISGHDSYFMKPAKARDDSRIPCRNVKALIKTASGSGAVVDVVNISRGGVCFTSVEKFRQGTPVSIATHYIEGGHNIYQNGRIIRVEREASAMLPGEYAIEFLPERRSKVEPVLRQATR